MDYVWRRLVITLMVIVAVMAPLPEPPRGYRYCDGDYTRPGLCMEIGTGALDWHSADTLCQTEYLPHPGKLVKLKDQDVQDWVAGLLAVMGWDYTWFNGYRRLKNNKHMPWSWQQRSRSLEIAYQGCYRDDPLYPDLQHLVPNSGNSPMQCLTLCDKKFASVQLDGEGVMHCRCGNDFGRYGRVYDAQCDTLCISSVADTDSINMFCGGQGYQRVYLRQGKRFHAFAATAAREYHHCVVMNHQFGHQWTEQNCHQTSPYICWYRGVGENQCGHTWAHSQCISIHHEEKDFFTATADCYSRDAGLLNLSDKSLQTAVTSLLNPAKSYYIGLTDDTWTDTDGNRILSYFNWAPGQPNDEQGNICLKMRANYGWYNSVCNRTLPFMCIISVSNSLPSPPSSSPASTVTGTTHLPIITPAPSPVLPVSTTTSTDQAPAQDTAGGLSQDLIIGVAAGGGGALLLTILLILCFCFCRRHYQQKSKKRKSRNRAGSQDLPEIPKTPLPVDTYYTKTNPAYNLDVLHATPGMHGARGPQSPRPYSEAAYADIQYTGYQDLDRGSIGSHTYNELNHDYHKYEYVDLPGQGKYASNRSGNKAGKGGYEAGRGKGRSDRTEYQSNRSDKSSASDKSGRSSHRSGCTPFQ